VITVYLASNNPGKVGEFLELAGGDPVPLDLRSARELGGMPAAEEDAGTFGGNARIKAFALRPLVPLGSGVLSDDSGLCVDALGGAPGVESAYFAGRPGDPAANLKLLAKRMEGVPPSRRSAHFTCVLMFIDPEGGEFSFEGRCDGAILDTPQGVGGFGYDPLFAPQGRGESFASLAPGEKNSLSARGRAWRKFMRWIQATYADQTF
jgi:XTP/dITP diphosphohydrolase